MTQDPTDGAPTPPPTTTVVQGERHDTRVVTDPDQGWKVEPVLPTDGERNSEEHSRASEEDGPPAMPAPGALAEEDLPSAWEAIRPGKDPADTGE